MRAFRFQRLIATSLFLLLVASMAAGVGWFGYSSALVQLAARGQADLSLASDRLVGQLQRFRQVAVMMADHPQLRAFVKGQGERAAIEHLLLSRADKTGSAAIMLASNQGRILAAAPVEMAGNLAAGPHFQRAMRGALGAMHSHLAARNQRIFSFAAPIIEQGAVLGAVIVAVDMETIEESDWRSETHTVFFTDQAGLIFVANRSELILRRKTPSEGAFPKRVSKRAGFEIWSINSGPYLPQTALHLTRPLPVIGMTAEVLVSTSAARKLAWLQALTVLAVLIGFGAILSWALERRRAVLARLANEARAKAELELRVERRTQELKQVQDDLVQAGKLAALGQMSAGISHELNQPLMAIRSFAENAETFLDRDKPETARRNLSKISELARRMGRIISNFRAFAKQESEPVSDVDIIAVISAVLEMSEARLARQQVSVDWRPPEAPLWVRGGEVRLQQVLTNLITNAMDAMEGSAEKRIEIAVQISDDKASIRLRDTGPGIKAPEKIFEPYYSTKAVGKSEGMGLGLSISYGLVQSFGGDIRGRNHEQGGAVFTVELPLADKGVKR